MFINQMANSINYCVRIFESCKNLLCKLRANSFVVIKCDVSINNLFRRRLPDIMKKDRIAVELEKNNALSLKDLAINGNDLIAAGFEKGKKLGLILNHLLDCVIEDPGMNTKDKLLEVASSLRA